MTFGELNRQLFIPLSERSPATNGFKPKSILPPSITTPSFRVILEAELFGIVFLDCFFI